MSEKQVCVSAVMTCSFTPAGMGLRLCPQFLPCVTGCVLHSAAAQEEPLRRDGTQCSQTQMLHPLLLCMMHFYLSEAVEVMLTLKATLRWQTVSQ